MLHATLRTDRKLHAFDYRYRHVSYRLPIVLSSYRPCRLIDWVAIAVQSNADLVRVIRAAATFSVFGTFVRQCAQTAPMQMSTLTYANGCV